MSRFMYHETNIMIFVTNNCAQNFLFTENSLHFHFKDYLLHSHTSWQTHV